MPIKKENYPGGCIFAITAECFFLSQIFMRERFNDTKIRISFNIPAVTS